MGLRRFWKSSAAAPAPGTSWRAPLHSHTGGRGTKRKENKKDTSSSATRHGGLSLAGLTSGTLHTLMYKYLPLAKVQAALPGCQTQQKAIIPGKVFTAAVAKGGCQQEGASDWPAGPPVTLKHLDTGHWPPAPGLLPPLRDGYLFHAQPGAATIRPTDVRMVLPAILRAGGLTEPSQLGICNVSSP